MDVKRNLITVQSVCDKSALVAKLLAECFMLNSQYSERNTFRCSPQMIFTL